MTVLIVDDNAAMRGMIRSLLPINKFRCFECADGVNALQRLEELHPDVVLMDVAMEPMDGITTTQKLKKEHPEVKVIMVTDFSDRRTREAAHAAGADGFIKKEDLMTVHDILKKMAD